MHNRAVTAAIFSNCTLCLHMAARARKHGVVSHMAVHLPWQMCQVKASYGCTCHSWSGSLGKSQHIPTNTPWSARTRVPVPVCTVVVPQIAPRQRSLHASDQGADVTSGTSARPKLAKRRGTWQVSISIVSMHVPGTSLPNLIRLLREVEEGVGPRPRAMSCFDTNVRRL